MLKIEFNKTGKVSFASFSNKKQNHRLQDPKVFLKEFLKHLDTENSKIEKLFTDELRMNHILLRRYFRGPVLAAKQISTLLFSTMHITIYTTTKK